MRNNSPEALYCATTGSKRANCPPIAHGVDEPAARESLLTAIRLAREYGIGWTEALAVEQLGTIDRLAAASG